MKFLSCCFLAFYLLCQSSLAHAKLVILYTPLDVPSDKRMEFMLAILNLGLTKTKDHYGDFDIKPVDIAQLPFNRGIQALRKNTYPNFFIVGDFRKHPEYGDDLIPVDFPADLGLLGYRVCFVNPQKKAEISKVASLKELTQYSIGQGSNWDDVAILRANGFNVTETDNYPSLFKMVARGRIDLFCRSIGEMKEEINTYRTLADLSYDESFVLHYQLPWYFYFNRNSTEAVKRLQEGLAIAAKDGSLKKLFLEYQQENLKFLKLSQRRVFSLQTPFENHLSDTYKNYMIDPTKIE